MVLRAGERPATRAVYVVLVGELVGVCESRKLCHMEFRFSRPTLIVRAYLRTYETHALKEAVFAVRWS